MKLIEEAKFIISRYDHYYESINSKSNLYLALNTFIIGGMITGFYALSEKQELGSIFQYLFYAIVLINFISILFTLSAIRPFLNKRRNKSSNKNNSIYYFGEVAKYESNSYTQAFSNRTEQELIEDAASQIHELAIGLKNKYNRIYLASVFIGVQAFLILIFATLLTIKY
jgi:hypothetical protein